jgi:hypothetical protein
MPSTVDWTNADVLVKNFKQFVKTNGLTGQYGYVLDHATIMRLLSQSGGAQDGIKIYLGFSPADKTICLVPVACQPDATNTDYNDFKLPVAKPSDTTALPLLATTRPCPPCCGTTNFLNKPA